MIHPSIQTAFSIQTHVALVLVLAFLLPAFDVPIGLAQVSTSITPTPGVGNLGTTVTASGHTIEITGGTRPGNGMNLFHSFDQFNVGHHDTAQFLNTTPSLHTSNILGRVTDGNPSSIFGTIDTMSYPGANLFLMNPAGIVFGPNATLHVSGSVAFTTANYLRLAEADGSHARIFHAETTSTSLLSSTSVEAFGFLGSNPAAIAVQGSTLKVPPGQSISLMGGNHGFTYTNPDTGSTASVPSGVTMTGGILLATSGQVNIASVASPGEILAGTLDQTANINGQTFEMLGTVQVSQQSSIDTSGEGGGTIIIRGGRLVVDDSTISANTKTIGPTTGPYVGPFGAGIDIHVAQDAIFDNGTVIETNAGPVAHNHESGGVRITAEHVTISGGPKILAILKTNPESDPPFAGIRSNVEPESTAANSGNISLHADSIRVQDLGQIETQTAGAGNAGHIILKASGNIDMDRADVHSFSILENSSGHSGNITISSSQGNVNLTNTRVTSQTGDHSGNAGRIAINAPQGNILLAGTQVFNFLGEGTGILGGIQITGHNLDLRNGAVIAGNNFARKVAGNIEITLDGRFTLAGGSAISTEAIGPANAADLIIRARDILIADGSSLLSPTFSPGAGGAINLSAQSLTIQTGGTISAETSGTAPSATGGSITVKTTDHVTMTDGASITASSKGLANAGDIKIDAGNRFEARDSSVTTNSEKVGGGNIKINALDQVRLVNSNVNASAFLDGGNITIDPNVIVLQNSDVTAKAVQGAGGNITLTTPLFLADSSSLVSASSQFGLNGTVTIQSPTSNLSESLGTLPSNPSQAYSLLTQRCAALANGQTSSFVVAGREQLPADPGGWLTSPLAFAALGESLDADHAIASTPAVMAMATDDTGTVSLRQLTPAGFLMANFADSEATGCRS